MMGLLKNFLITASLLFLNAQVSAQSPATPVLSLYCEDDKPLQFYDENKKLTGLTVEVVQEIQRRIGNKDRIQVVEDRKFNPPKRSILPQSRDHKCKSSARRIGNSTHLSEVFYPNHVITSASQVQVSAQSGLIKQHFSKRNILSTSKSQQKSPHNITRLSEDKSKS